MTLLDLLTDDVLARDKDGWRRVEVTPNELDRIMEEKVPKYSRVFAGGYHVTIPEIKRRYISFVEYPATSGELARAYIRWCYESSEWGGLPFRGPSPTDPAWRLKAPIFTRRAHHRALAYVDLNHAYWAIAKHYTADHCVTADRRQVPGCVSWLNVDDVDDDRRLRHTVVGSLLSSQLRWLSYGNEKMAPVPYRAANPSLAQIILGTLNAVARDVMASVETFAWLTDACIVPRREATAVVELLASHWSMPSRVVADGMGAVWSPSTYRVGDKASLDIVNGNAHYSVTETNKVARVNVRRMKQWRKEAVT